MNVNLFPDVDASFYIENLVEKHHAVEFHTYKCMAQFSQSHYFQSEESCGHLDYRKITLKVKNAEPDEFKTLLVTPLGTTSVSILQDETNPNAKFSIESSPLEQDV
jgi:hypothetical protein